MEVNRWKILGLATAVQASSTMITYGVGPIATVWQEQLGLSQSQVGFLVSTVNLGPLFSMIWLGRALDRYGERWLMGMGTICIGGMFIGISMVQQYLILCLALLGIGLFYGIAQPGGTRVITRLFSKEERGLAMGIRQAAIPLGGGLAGYFVSTFSELYHLSLTMTVLGSLAVLTGMIFLWGFRNEKGKEVKKEKTSSFRLTLRILWQDRRLYPLIGIGMVLISLQAILVAHLTAYLKLYSSYSAREAAMLFVFTFFMGMIGRILLPWLADRFGSQNYANYLAWSAGAVILGLWLLILAPKAIPMGIAILIFSWLGLFALGWYSFFILEVTKRSADDAVGVTVGYVLTWNQIALILSPWWFGILVDFFHDFKLAWISWTGCMSLILVVALIFEYRYRRTQTRA
ncbi:MFS transporter [Thermoflavimicrobium daqui]|uniref:MFS transporter n=1 Tax=Thermoflavimicrobium daqui TaxID=2137476 RepID=A0A364K7L3_9BACL|nr:MFS transporter [Thermoflavimicrobium daqui]RAL26277.1 MFS transporter [Thermoflavimicrobium daqui]